MTWQTKIPKFRRFVLQNFPFIEQDFDALTDYQLICKVVEYLNQVITSQNAVIDEVGEFETEVSNDFNRLEGLFNELNSYVDNYFDNLDVQEEINNKLDDMAEAGTLQEIIASYINSTALWVFDNVSAMAQATNLIDGSYAKTIGYYAANDGGGAVYKVTSTLPSGYYETLAGNLYAELINTETVSVKQFGVKGDGTTDDSSKFASAINTGKRIIIPEGTYLIDRFLPSDNQTYIGEGNCIVLTNGIAPQVVISNNFSAENITFQSNSNDLQWNRTEINGKANINLFNCSFKNFKHDSAQPNAWGILIGDSSNIVIESCYFEDNSQADIALVMGCKQILINNCRGTALNINIEPDNITNTNENIKISNCNIAILKAQETQYTGTCTKSLLVENCTIDNFRYDGSTMTLLNCVVKKYTNSSSNVKEGGVLRIINSGNFTNNLIDDPYLDLFQNTTDSVQPWLVVSNPLSLQNAFTSVKDENGIQFVINHLNNTTGIQIKHQNISISEDYQYLLRITGKCVYPESGTNYISLISKILWLNSEDETIQTDVISLFRSTANTTSEFGEESCILVPPEGASKMSIRLFNSTAPTAGATGSQSTYIRSVELFRINEYSKAPNELSVLPVRQNRIFKKETQVGGTFNKYIVGDMLLFSNPTTYIGKVCTVEGYGNSATWKDFGALAA